MSSHEYLNLVEPFGSDDTCVIERCVRTVTGVAVVLSRARYRRATSEDAARKAAGELEGETVTVFDPDDFTPRLLIVIENL